jgi:hypothetical protein
VSKQDPELLQLSKEVLDRTGWGGVFVGDSLCYTSDYILTKIPHGIKVDNAIWVFNLHSNGTIWFAGTDLSYFSGDSPWMFEGDTPLKALLKLTIALYDNGILTQEETTHGN